MESSHRPTFIKIFLQFLKIGFIAFGGPAAHAGLMEHELVSRKKWLKPQAFLDYLGAVNLIPGPNSTQLTMLAGYQLRGFWGMVAGGMGFVLPAALITGVLAWVYVRTGDIPAIGGLFYGIKPAVIAVIAAAILKLGQKAVKNVWLGALGVITLAAYLFGLNEITAIIGAGVLGMAAFAARRGLGSGKGAGALAPFILLNGGLAAATQYSALKLFWIFFKIGALLFGTGYVLVAYMDGELVEKAGWLTREQLLDAIAIGQFTPGPILSAATFAGYIIDGWQGAAIATAAIFLPSFAFILLLYPLIPRLRKSPFTAAFLDSVNVGAVAVMAGVSLVMALEVVVDWGALLILLAALAALLGPWKKKPGAVWVILGGAVLGLVWRFLVGGG
jgi:chromate transporter